jgi:hypothetical protein
VDAIPVAPAPPVDADVAEQLAVLEVAPAIQVADDPMRTTCIIFSFSNSI